MRNNNSLLMNTHQNKSQRCSVQILSSLSRLQYSLHVEDSSSKGKARKTKRTTSGETYDNNAYIGTEDGRGRADNSGDIETGESAGESTAQFKKTALFLETMKTVSVGASAAAVAEVSSCVTPDEVKVDWSPEPEVDA